MLQRNATTLKYKRLAAACGFARKAATSHISRPSSSPTACWRCRANGSQLLIRVPARAQELQSATESLAELISQGIADPARRRPRAPARSFFHGTYCSMFARMAATSRLIHLISSATASSRCRATNASAAPWFPDAPTRKCPRTRAAKRIL